MTPWAIASTLAPMARSSRSSPATAACGSWARSASRASDDQRGKRVARAAVVNRGDAIARGRASRLRARRLRCAARGRRGCATSPPARRAAPGRRSAAGAACSACSRRICSSRGAQRGDLLAQRFACGRRGGARRRRARRGAGRPAARASSSLRRRAICAAASCGSKRGRSAGWSRARPFGRSDGSRRRSGSGSTRRASASRRASRSRARGSSVRSTRCSTAASRSAAACSASARSARLSRRAIAASSRSSPRRDSLAAGASRGQRGSTRGRARRRLRSVLASRQAGDSLADRVEAVVALQIGRLDAALGGAFGDHFIKPVAKTEPGPPGGLFRENARLAPHAPDAPGRRAVHRFARGRPLANRCAAGSTRRDGSSFPPTW